MKGVKKAAVCLLLCIAVCAGVPAAISANANSAMLYWRGAYAAGAAVLDENCPVRVESELLTFNINEFPQDFYDDTAEDYNNFLGYGANVTARYNFYNPADYGVEMTLAFPFGGSPDYAYFYDEIDDTEKYSVTADGEEIGTRLRHTLAYGNFDTETDAGRLVDGFKEDGFYSEDLPVYVYRFHIDGITYNGDYSVHAELVLNETEGRKIISTAGGYNYEKNGFSVSWYVRNGYELVLYSIGKPISDDEFNFSFFYYYGRFNFIKTISGNAERNPDKDEQITFKQLALGSRSEDSVVSETDWYNAVVDSINLDESRGGYISYYCLNPVNSLMRWYEYSLSIPAGGRLVNEVTAPVYPSINGYYSPLVYGYEYLLSPAQSWAEFGALEVRINTPYFITESSVNGLEKTDYGYVYRTDGLPDGEFAFTLCEAERPERSGSGCNGYTVAFIILPIIILGGFITVVGGAAAGITLLIMFIVKKSKTKRQ